MNEEIEALRREVAALRQQIDAVDDWANGVQVSLIQVLPQLLRDHPRADAVRTMLEHSHDRHQALLLDPQAGEPGDTAALYESRAMLYRTLALLGVWPGIDPQEWMWLNSPQPTPPRRQR